MKSWQKKEKYDQKDFNTRSTPRSGGLWFIKGDSRNKRFFIESKDTKYERFTVTKKMWEKVWNDALKSPSRIPILSVKMGDLELVVLDKNDFITLDA